LRQEKVQGLAAAGSTIGLLLDHGDKQLFRPKQQHLAGSGGDGDLGVGGEIGELLGAEGCFCVAVKGVRQAKSDEKKRKGDT
jgi:hypothetical protein